MKHHSFAIAMFLGYGVVSAQYDISAIMNFANQMNQVTEAANQSALQSMQQENEELRRFKLRPLVVSLSQEATITNLQTREYNKEVMQRRAQHGDAKAQAWLVREKQRETLAVQTMENSQQWQQEYQAKVRNDNRRAYETIQRSNDLHTANQAVIQDESDIRNAQNSEDLQRALNNYQRDVQERKEIEDR